jgi:outer membrane autotransporter protein
MKKLQKSSQADKGLPQKTQLARAIALGFLLLSNPFIGDVNAAACSPSTGLDISTMGGTNSATISCDANPAPVINEISDQSTFTNSGVIKNTSGSWYSLYSKKGIGTFENSGTIGNSASSGLVLDSGYTGNPSSAPSTAIFSVLSNTSTGQIISNSGDALYLGNGAKITTLNNSGEIKNLSGSTGIVLTNSSTGKLSEIGVLNNLSGATISGDKGIRIQDFGLITTLNNSGSIYGAEAGIRMQSSGNTNPNFHRISKIVTLNNTGSIYSTSTGTGASDAAIRVEGEITNLTNSGRIYNNIGYGISVRSALTTSNGGGTDFSKIGTLTNTGEISGGTAGIFLWANADMANVYYSGAIETLNNAQGGNGSTAAATALTYNGNLPTNYNIIVNSATRYGQLNYYKGSAGAPSLASLNFGIDSSSTLAVGTYRSVLSSKTSNFGSAGTAFAGTPTLLTSNLGTYTLTTSDSGVTYDLNILTLNYTNFVTLANNPAGTGAASVLNQVSGSSGSMATLITYLNGSSTAQQKSNAISQTLPVIVGAAPAATVNTARNLTQIVQARQSQIAGLSSGEEFVVNKDVWMKSFGVWGKQDDLNSVSGYALRTGGLALGGDKALSSRANIGGVLAFASSSVDGNNAAAPNTMTIDSYQVGSYGDYAITDQLNYNYQLDIGINRNKGKRNILTAGVIASSDYYSYSAHLGSGLKYMMPVAEKLTFIPSARVDYTQVHANSYSETGADTLNLQTGSQKYEEFLVTADLRFDYEFNGKLKGTINAGVSYNTMNDQVQITSAYQGGGPSFTTSGMKVSPTLYEGGFGVIGDISKDVELIGRYDVQYRTTGYFSQMASIRVKINF